MSTDIRTRRPCLLLELLTIYCLRWELGPLSITFLHSMRRKRGGLVGFLVASLFGVWSWILSLKHLSNHRVRFFWSPFLAFSYMSLPASCFMACFVSWTFGCGKSVSWSSKTREFWFNVTWSRYLRNCPVYPSESFSLLMSFVALIFVLFIASLWQMNQPLLWMDLFCVRRALAYDCGSGEWGWHDCFLSLLCTVV
jgi:hypothetical protein